MNTSSPSKARLEQRREDILEMAITLFARDGYADADLERWRALYRDLIAQGRMRPLPVERVSDVIGDLLYGAMFVNYIANRNRPPDELARDIIDVVFNGILTDAERKDQRSE